MSKCLARDRARWGLPSHPLCLSFFVWQRRAGCVNRGPPSNHPHSFSSSQENSLEQLPWSYREKTRFGRLAQDLIEELVGSCRRKPFALVCGSAEFTEDMASCLLRAGLTKDSYFLF